MTKKIDFEKIFFRVSKELKDNEGLIKQEFLAEIKTLAENWIEDRFREMKNKKSPFYSSKKVIP